MFTHYPYQTLGHAQHGWLDARHHFSFARYWNPNRTGFGTLLVINDDTVAAGRGFATHPHDNMEIITYVRSGAITHTDSLGNVGRTQAGDVQVMSAGSGVAHSEMNAESVDTRLYQIWIEPNKKNVAPRWDAKQFPNAPVKDQLTVLVSGMDRHADIGAMFIYQDAAMYGGTMHASTRITQPIVHQAYILASRGRFSVNGHIMQEGDGAEVAGEKELVITASTEAEIVVIDVPAVNTIIS